MPVVSPCRIHLEALGQDVYGAGIAALVRDSYSLVEGKAAR